MGPEEESDEGVMDRERLKTLAGLEERRRHRRQKHSRGADVDEMRGRIASFAQFQGNVIRSYAKRLKAAAHKEDADGEPTVKKLIKAMDDLNGVMADLRRLT